MFTLNTIVNYGETLQFKAKKKQKNKRKRKHNSELASAARSEFEDMEVVGTDDAAVSEASDQFNPVHCSNCNTRLAVYDSDDIYHFFNVIASYS